MDQQDMERIFSWHVLVTPQTPRDLPRDQQVATRASAAGRTPFEARKVEWIRRQENTRPEGTVGDTGLDL